jgi:hypothetical protein
MNEEFYNKQEALRHGDRLYKQGNRHFAMSSYTTAEGQWVYFFDWSSGFTCPESIHAEWTY